MAEMIVVVEMRRKRRRRRTRQGRGLGRMLEGTVDELRLEIRVGRRKEEEAEVELGRPLS